MAIFEERRKGKTEFLTDDLAPLAEDYGHRCCYVNFWEDKSSPVRSIVSGVERSLAKELSGVLIGWKKELSLNLGGLTAKLTSNTEKDVHTAYQALDLLLKPKGTVLLQCDEIQHLATQPEFEIVAASLRTWIQANKDRVRVVFTGSSRDKLDRLFRNKKAAFYNSASIVVFPDMGYDFAEFLSNRFEYLTRRSLAPDDVMRAFLENHSSPAFIVELLQVMMREGVYSLDEGLEYFLANSRTDSANIEVWNNLKVLDRMVLSFLAQDNAGPLYSDAQTRIFSDKIGAKVTSSMVQASLQRLRDEEIVVNVSHGCWQIEDSDFKRFVLENDA